MLSATHSSVHVPRRPSVTPGSRALEGTSAVFINFNLNW